MIKRYPVPFKVVPYIFMVAASVSTITNVLV